MKKLLAVLLAVLFVMNTCAALAESEEFTVKTYSDYDSLFSIDVDKDKDIAFVETKCSVADLAFVHKHESDYSYSYIQSDLLVLDYYSTDRYPIFRTWVYYSAATPLYIHSISFEFEGKKYMFTDVGDADRVKQGEHDYTESLLIKYGQKNSDFFAAVLLASVRYAMDKDENKTAPQMKMTLIGLEEIEVTVPEEFWQDFALLGLPFLANDLAWIKYIAKTEGTPCKVTE